VATFKGVTAEARKINMIFWDSQFRCSGALPDVFMYVTAFRRQSVLYDTGKAAFILRK